MQFRGNHRSRSESRFPWVCHCILTPEAPGGSAVSFPDVPETLACGISRARALSMAEDALTVTLGEQLRQQRDLAVPSRCLTFGIASCCKRRTANRSFDLGSTFCIHPGRSADGRLAFRRPRRGLRPRLQRPQHLPRLLPAHAHPRLRRPPRYLEFHQVHPLQRLPRRIVLSFSPALRCFLSSSHCPSRHRSRSQFALSLYSSRPRPAATRSSGGRDVRPGSGSPPPGSAKASACAPPPPVGSRPRLHCPPPPRLLLQRLRRPPQELAPRPPLLAIRLFRKKSADFLELIRSALSGNYRPISHR